MLRKELVVPERVRRLPDRYSWVDPRLVRAGHFRLMGKGEAALYLFLLTVGDAQGLSYYGDGKICEQMSCDLATLRICRENLIRLGLVGYRRPFYQVLDLAMPRPSIDMRCGNAKAESQGGDPKRGGASDKFEAGATSRKSTGTCDSACAGENAWERKGNGFPSRRKPDSVESESKKPEHHGSKASLGETLDRVEKEDPDLARALRKAAPSNRIPSRTRSIRLERRTFYGYRCRSRTCPCTTNRGEARGNPERDGERPRHQQPIT